MNISGNAILVTGGSTGIGLAGTSIRVFETVPPLVDTELNQEGRIKRNLLHKGVKADAFAPTVLDGLANDEFEIGHKPSKK